MINEWNHRLGIVLSHRVPRRVAVIGAGIAGLTCARELLARGDQPVVFEASDRLGGRCSSRQTRIGWFDDAAQTINKVTRLCAYAAHQDGEPPALQTWTVPSSPAEDERKGRLRADEDDDDDDADVVRSFKLLGAVGAPTMLALARAVAHPLDVRLNSTIVRATRCRAGWMLKDGAGRVHEDFDALVLAIPAPLAVPLAAESRAIATALRSVRYRSRWVLLLGSERKVGLPGYREFLGSPIERVAAMHTKPGHPASIQQRWFIEADERWSMQHEQDDAEVVAEHLFDMFCAHVGRPVIPNFLQAIQWRHGFSQSLAVQAGQSDCLWDGEARLGVCGDSVVASQVDRVHASGIALARRMFQDSALESERSLGNERHREPSQAIETYALHG